MARQSLAQLFAVAAIVLLASSCSSESSDEALITGDNGSTLATVSYVELEGGFYGIITDEGEHHEPVNLHVDYQVDGLSIIYKYKTLGNIGSFRMWGTPVEILEIREQSKK